MMLSQKMQWCLYLKIPHEEGLALALTRIHLENRENKEVKTDTLIEFADIAITL